jgi:hypothetical protein
MVKEDTKWETFDRKWATYTASRATKIIIFFDVNGKG